MNDMFERLRDRLPPKATRDLGEHRIHAYWVAQRFADPNPPLDLETKAFIRNDDFGKPEITVNS